MTFNYRLAIISDPHVGLPHTIENNPNRFHLIEVSIPALETAFNHLEQLNIDLLLMPGDLTQDGEKDNHRWLQERLASLPYPVYVVPGNHDVRYLSEFEGYIALRDFSVYYQDFGYADSSKLYYSREVLPGLQLIGLNSNRFDADGQQLGSLDEEQLLWLDTTLAEIENKLVLVMIHHNVIEHLPGQSQHQLGKRYMLDNAETLKQILRKYGVKLVITGHLHVQDVATEGELTEITTGSTVSYPHPYRVLDLQCDQNQQVKLSISSHRVKNVPGWENLQLSSRESMAQKSDVFMLKLLTGYPFNLAPDVADLITPKLRYFWADIAAGDAIFDFSDLPEPIGGYLERFGAKSPEGYPNLIDNHSTLLLKIPKAEV
ncbi:metallophosphoesterase [Gloeocapsa sp. PCC 73106]|uniref:metallophosphoesterase family protein n=1 Tax=Gloeocapsa sp. PCC 73106 TaxID=102232 RepID=UPI0002ABF32B|nr:metallophosphoesterase [Gloeocapsa sp. PCC 73106]ELR98506.1 putative phosphohydrolase [Gloeocapsa sp. PCC 73106]